MEHTSRLKTSPVLMAVGKALRKKLVAFALAIVCVVFVIASYRVGYTVGSAASSRRWSDNLHQWRAEDRRALTWHVAQINGDIFELRSAELLMRFRFEDYDVGGVSVLGKLRSEGLDDGWLVTPTDVLCEGQSRLVIGRASIRGAYIDKDLQDIGVLKTRKVNGQP